MADDRPWYREPETFIAVAALVVSISAVVVGLYEAHLQRQHDRAEVWPRVEIYTFKTTQGASVYLDNGGIGPAVVQSIEVFVDGRLQRTWLGALTTLLGHRPTAYNNSTVANRAIRAGDRVELVGITNADMPPDLWKLVPRVRVRVCYTSVFGEAWSTEEQLGASERWSTVSGCPAQRDSVEF